MVTPPTQVAQDEAGRRGSPGEGGAEEAHRGPRASRETAPIQARPADGRGKASRRDPSWLAGYREARARGSREACRSESAGKGQLATPVEKYDLDSPIQVLLGL